MTKKKGPFTEVSRVEIYKNPWIQVVEVSVIRPSGVAGQFGLVYMNPGSTVVALDDDLNVFLAYEYKYAVDTETVELVSGGIDEGETPEAAGVRELREEAGFTANRVTRLGKIDPFTSVINSPNYIILAQDLKPAPLHSEDVVTCRAIPFLKAIEMVEAGEITHAASCVGLLMAERHLRKMGEL